MLAVKFLDRLALIQQECQVNDYLQHLTFNNFIATRSNSYHRIPDLPDSTNITKKDEF